jgi:hypothetical protein
MANQPNTATRGHDPLAKSEDQPNTATRGHVPLTNTEEKYNSLWTQKFGCKDITSDEQLWNTEDYIKHNRIKHELPIQTDEFYALQEQMCCTFDHAFRTEYKGGFDVVIGNPPYVLCQPSNTDEITPSELLRIIINGIEDNIRKISKYQYKYMTITIFSHDKNGNFVYAGQHQDLLIFRSENSTIESIPTEGLWIGLGKLTESNNNLIQDKTFQMKKGDTLLLYTDGVTESEESEGKMLGSEGLAEILIHSKENSTTEIKDQILEKLESYTTKDDTTFLIIKKLF